MIKVIATDLDGTLLGEDHKVSPRNLAALKKAADQGIRIIVVTGRYFGGALSVLENHGKNWDMLCNSGACVFNQNHELVLQHDIDWEKARKVMEFFKDTDLAVKYIGKDGSAFIGTADELRRKAFLEAKTFNPEMSDEELMNSERVKYPFINCEMYEDFDSMKAGLKHVNKIFVFGAVPAEEMIAIKKKLAAQMPDLAIASSFPTNIEISDIKGQKGPVLKEYIESAGYTMDEVLVFGDSENDLSMMEMDFVTVAMGNADEDIKKVSKYITKPNTEDGVGWTVEQMLEKQASQNAQRA